MSSLFGVVDLFAGPGGLGEGFASIARADHSPFRICLSAEVDNAALRTLRLRAFLRNLRRRNGYLPAEYIEFHAGRTAEPEWAEVDAESWKIATDEARQIELGSHEASGEIDLAVNRIRSKFDDTILIGGPPCQAYSLAGRARTRGNLGYVPENDQRHYLFREYISVLDKLRPAAFVMENVKGILSSTVESRLIFEMLMEDLSSLGTGRGSLYELRAFTVDDDRCRLGVVHNPSDFVVRAESLGVPQRRHRVFIIGLRSDVAARASCTGIRISEAKRSLSDAIADMPVLRSGLSRGADSADEWQRIVQRAAERLVGYLREDDSKPLRTEFEQIAQEMQAQTLLERSSRTLPLNYGKSDNDLKRWLENDELSAIAQHETRGHMDDDLSRYLFAAVYGKLERKSPKASQFPLELTPLHRNWRSGAFSDRFRVQLANEPSTTVTSHISKDGHYYIHYDPMQCRSLTVREAARLQTFPDDYLFLGNRTQQYVQVGNAVPPYLARKIALLLSLVLEGESSEVSSL